MVGLKCSYESKSILDFVFNEILPNAIKDSVQMCLLVFVYHVGESCVDVNDLLYELRPVVYEMYGVHVVCVVQKSGEVMLGTVVS